MLAFGYVSACPCGVCVCEASGADWASFNLPTQWPRRDRCLLYGSNDLQLAKPFFFPILLQTLSFVIFLVQVLLQMTPSSSSLWPCCVWGFSCESYAPQSWVFLAATMHSLSHRSSSDLQHTTACHVMSCISGFYIVHIKCLGMHACIGHAVLLLMHYSTAVSKAESHHKHVDVLHCNPYLLCVVRTLAHSIINSNARHGVTPFL